MAFFESSDGVRLSYEVAGDGPPLLLHLGAGCDAGLWRAAGYVDPLARDYTCVLFDHRGHGASDKPRGAKEYGIERMTDDVVELLDHIGIESTAFWGYSAGMSPGIRLADREPSRVWAVIGSGAVGPPDPPDELAAWVTKTSAEFREHGWEKLLARFDKQEPQPIPEWMKERIRATDVEQFADQLEALPDWQWEEWDALPLLDTPVLFVTGELEDKDNDVGEVVGRMRRGEVLRLEGLGHINAFLATDLVLPRVQEFLAANAPKA